MLKVLAFDFFGTVANMADVPRDEIRAYLATCVARPWKELELPATWGRLPMHADAADGIRRLSTKFKVVTLSNGPVNTIAAASERGGVAWYGYTPLAKLRTYKPDPLAYLAICKYFGVTASEVMVVTANPKFGPFDFGDLQIARMVGMQALLIRQPGCPQTIIEVAEWLGC